MELEKNKDKFEALGANLVAISSDPADAEKIRAKLGITFTIYSDPDLEALQNFGVLDPANAIARPAAFIVSRDGKIQFRYIGENASDTVLLKVLFAELEKLQGGAAEGAGG